MRQLPSIFVSALKSLSVQIEKANYNSDGIVVEEILEESHDELEEEKE